MSDFFDGTIERLRGEMHLTLAEQAVHAQNIANANNPNYTPKSFDRILQKVIEQQAGSPVVLEEELKAMGGNAMRYSAITRLFNAKLNVLRTVITQGRR